MIAGEHVVDCLPRVDDHDAVFWRRCEQDMISGFDIVDPSRGGWDDDAGPGGYAEKTAGGGENYDAAEGRNYFELVPGLPAESMDDIAVLDPAGCVDWPDAVEHCGVWGELPEVEQGQRAEWLG